MRHKGLRRWLEDGKSAGLPPAYARKIEAIVSFLAAAPNIQSVQKLRLWRAHQLTGNLAGVWSLTVSRNWRITFRVNAENAIEDFDLLDYH